MDEPAAPVKGRATMRTALNGVIYGVDTEKERLPLWGLSGGRCASPAWDGQQAQDVEATVDTGAAYTTLPGSLLRELGIEPMDKGVFLLADGRRVEMDIGRAWATVDGSSEVTLVVFGEDDAPALMGAYTLEGLRLAVDPIAQRLVPTHLIMY